GRFRATIGNKQLLAVTPESTQTTSANCIYRHAPADGADIWYRHTYPTSWRSLYTEPDGTILAGNTGAEVWQIDVPDYTHGDDGTAIPVRFWTAVDDDGKPYIRKDPQDLRVSLATCAGTASAALALDALAAASFTAAPCRGHAHP